MNYFSNLSIRYKLLAGFLLVFLVLAGVSVFLFFFFYMLATSVSNLNTITKKQVVFNELATDTQRLSDSVKSYMLTSDPIWQKRYDQTALDLSTHMTQAKNQKEGSEIATLQKLDTTITNLRGVEL